jgi:3-hydroxyisobutyrate dehydrogenase-like beta-hydroxyacid dehydrogenase
MPDTIGFIGLGNLGRPIASNLLAGGFPLRIYNRSADKLAPFVEKGAMAASSPPAAAARGGIVISVVADDRALESVADDALAEALGPGGIHVSMSTILPATSEKLAAHHRQFGATYLAAPVFGRPEAAAARKLWICTSGDPAAKPRLQPIFDAIGQGVFDFGEAVGAANVVKLAGNFLIHAAIEALAETGAMSEKAGIPRAAVFNFLSQTLFNCPIYHNYSKKLTEATWNEVGFTLALALKDMGLVGQVAAGHQTPMPILNIIKDRLLTAMAKGRSGMDATAMAQGPAEDAGLAWGKR